MLIKSTTILRRRKHFVEKGGKGVLFAGPKKREKNDKMSENRLPRRQNRNLQKLWVYNS